ncbi:uncharacterized protein LOC111357902 [Spodoptera litura]|uniref:Uncharacterized protein LOC111357902 n=1 Tax=Spodoptera litura TaxID=69820 RepID=A0A9J7ECV4_SPOLT|nr:uncharacterized protein LOC111357902 [Spodoptera litura]
MRWIILISYCLLVVLATPTYGKVETNNKSEPLKLKDFDEEYDNALRSSNYNALTKQVISLAAKYEGKGNVKVSYYPHARAEDSSGNTAPEPPGTYDLGFLNFKYVESKKNKNKEDHHSEEEEHHSEERKPRKPRKPLVQRRHSVVFSPTPTGGARSREPGRRLSRWYLVAACDCRRGVGVVGPIAGPDAASYPVGAQPGPALKPE